MSSADLTAALTPISRFLPAEPASVPAARRFVADALTGWRLPHLLDDATVCVSELVSNAVRHGSPPGRAIHLGLLPLLPAGLLRLEVGDDGPGVPRPRAPVADDAIGGRGLLLVAALASAWGSEPRPLAGKVVWCEWEVPW
ncbi:ATP-binding protein [Allostreptomyces psammosilenae]|uniref:Anti-sigma regulatory factor (Ser/Thr protein kinase) n=1 Tax=Allostreptomyces psammosilenae TaxID=1892865 RepID=A0A853ABI7_9ACTN|nr:ATP-binding protein [Allostreptomyces psammosilenae]NYI07848.1 anti-sigma regulatory factor (Ser/Thr protein kinase) [Allostreptomyces psammosilenae]